MFCFCFYNLGLCLASFFCSSFCRLFKDSPHPDEKQRQQLSKRLGLSPRQVKFWFQNRRTQIKVCLKSSINPVFIKNCWELVNLEEDHKFLNNEYIFMICSREAQNKVMKTYIQSG